ncbi:MAG TPA: 2Fe-2S iron-sulfur cluster-binding protein [Parapedobacter sp.]|uniref:2Fe-2S iron-sulfur cluster-binding protein n=1 Tax=Parapedobacter sp. TaxID=1958893 RepID=UPI002B6A3A1E|nr:2Fe-2S iron-sulfur cluster-binding protein [Parapedobacter sp.]HWK58222.1 2Fe-2S iron-sulfur cluster-binding protein [Parapedobacter sp.]
MTDTIHITVENQLGEIRQLEIPEGINLSLMEVLKASDYDILATCGGMALCATCHIEVLEGMEALEARSDAELDMLDTLPRAGDQSRLACQIRLNAALDGLKIRIFANN